MDQYQLLIDKALKFLSFRPRSKKEIIIKLQPYALKRSIPSQILDRVISDLEQRNLINDKEFTQWWIAQREAFRPKGDRLLKIELRQKGIENSIIAEILDNARKLGSTEFEQALTLAQKRYIKISQLPEYKIKEKITGLLGRRGFAYETIYKVIDTIIKKD